jgi:hypothetical protein
MDSIHEQVQQNYDKYEELMRGTKLSKRKYFQLIPGDVSKNDWYLGKLSLIHVGGMDCHMDTEKSKRVADKYRFILFSKGFAKEPICRFDSTGNEHTNSNPNIPLEQRQVPVPHFHCYDKDGYGYAYQTPSLIRETKGIQKNIKVGWRIMCDEYNIFTDDNLIPDILEMGELFPRQMGQNDVHADVSFRL